eukprot:825115-Rhodomonas_salina.3
MHRRAATAACGRAREPVAVVGCEAAQHEVDDSMELHEAGLLAPWPQTLLTLQHQRDPAFAVHGEPDPHPGYSAMASFALF